MNPFASLNAGLRRALPALLLALPLAAAAAEPADLPDARSGRRALSAALKANDERALLAIFGEQHKALVVDRRSPANDAAKRAEAGGAAVALPSLHASAADQRVLLVGEQAWPLPIPLLREQGAWRFATERGVDEILNRRIGANERQAVGVLRAYIDAQREYASRDRNGDGVLEYASQARQQPGQVRRPVLAGRPGARAKRRALSAR